MEKLLQHIKQPDDIKKIPQERLQDLADEIRDYLIHSVSRTGGHLASNLGVVELTIALHYVYSLPKDKIIWDVGHQAYTHKILTGRKEDFAWLRKEGGISGFPRREESDCDCWDAGHSSNSISAGLGYVEARDLAHADYSVVSVIGDGALTGGMAFEAMNNAAQLKTNFVTILNDNNMSISRNVGGLHNYLTDLRTSPAYTDFKGSVQDRLEKIPGIGEKMVSRIRRTKSSLKQLVIPGMFFEDMGITYLGPVDGHNIRGMIRALQEAKRVNGPVLLHVLTEKGRGFAPATRHPERFHGTGAFDINTGVPLSNGNATYTDIFSTVMRKMGERDASVVAVTAAMAEGTGLKRFANRFPDRFFDAGIAEEHAVTFAAGLALGGLKPVLAIYSSFLQRGFDQLMEDICMQKLHVVLAVDRAGFVGADGKTHNGCFDLSYLSMMPEMTILAPKNKWELSDMMKFALAFDGPVAIRYPRGDAWTGLEEHRAPVEYGKAEVIRRGKKIALLPVGAMMKEAVAVAEALEKKGYEPTLVNMRFVKPLDEQLLLELSEDHELFVTMEENARRGGFGVQVLDFVNSGRLPVHVEVAAIPDSYIHHASPERQRELCGLDAESMTNRILNYLEENNGEETPGHIGD
uniref:1-deoxy-D-xylulose-5-phosphate synthase n=1 Tax=Eubacterium cellulosolvens TaxID=29322 RepID=UPI00054D879F|nr:1-deoxy-D-xylulose-5-phosphate synthase [[Eubacterium] cellulosolvens]